MVNKIDIVLPSGLHLVAEQNTDPAFQNEIFIGISDGNGVWYQDLAVVRNAYEYDGDKVVWKEDEFDILVWGNENNEDFTNEYTVGLYHGGV